ncbi:Regulator of G protein signaling superfamily, partial [Metarhizium majus ARSEF 297]
MGSEFGITPDTKPEVRLDGVGIFWIVFAVTWTVILISGMAFLWTKRDMPILRIRGLGLSFTAIAFLHCYWVAVTTGYVYGPLMPEVAEFWIMSIWFPFGIALFHASNSRFLYVANAQKQYVKKTGDLGWDGQRPRIRKTLVARWKMLPYTQRVLIFVGLGMVAHLSLTIFMFLISRKFHSGWGISGTEVTGTAMEQKTEQGRGWECLHASPMWLIALYVPGMAPVNNYFIPPQWIAIAIMMLEIFTVFIPVWEVRRQQSLCQETLDSIARWESRQKSVQHSGKSLHSGTSSSSWMGRTKAGSVSTTGGSILTMDALEHTLAKNPEPLQEFSALRDFSGENIAFLTRVREWRAQYIVNPSLREPVRDEKDSEKTLTLSRECFESALRIYIDFISSNSAEFQVNLSSQDFKNLQAIFEGAARVVCGECSTPDPATPFADVPKPQSESGETARYWGDIPEAFNEGVFDDSEMSIKYLVLTNTWPKFIRERRSFDGASSAEAGK